MSRVNCFVWMVCLLAGGPVTLGQGDAQRVAELEAQVTALRQKVADLEAENAELRRKLNLTEQQKQDLTVERTQLEKLAGVTSKGEAVETAAALIESSYDAQANRTQVYVKPRRIETSSPGPFEIEHHLSLAYQYPGEKMQQSPPPPPEEVRMMIDVFQHPVKSYSALKQVTFDVDGRELVVPVANYQVLKTYRSAPSLRRGSDRQDERLTLSLDAATLRTLAAATQVTLKLPGNELIFEREHLAMVGAVQQRISMGL
ncbi:MAG: hypothetical protein IT445_14805 [Phycisphaeraceae bacterium]|nr:hypothetical protein [Phycisphaeraceae bacterium]